MKYAIILPKSVQKQLDKLPAQVQPRVITKIQSLALSPRPDGVSKLKGYEHQYRVRVGSYRIRYEIDDNNAIIKLLQCKHRRDVYKDRG